MKKLIAAFLSTLSLRRATLRRMKARVLEAISIHALLAESDRTAFQGYSCIRISIHALLAESDDIGIFTQPFKPQFLSTLSLRRATLKSERWLEGTRDISIHALLAESDRCISGSCIPQHWYFYPRSPCGERRYCRFEVYGEPDISIHALLAESDRAPPYNLIIQHTFLSTLSLRRATSPPSITPTASRRFLSTLSLRRATTSESSRSRSNLNFYPRSPCGERP